MFGWTEAEALGCMCPTVPRVDRPAFRRMIRQALFAMDLGLEHCGSMVETEQARMPALISRLVLDDEGGGLSARTQRGGALRGIAARVKGLGGRWHIASKQRRGTRLVVEVPLS